MVRKKDEEEEDKDIKTSQCLKDTKKDPFWKIMLLLNGTLSCV